jgi:hypothetical protein
MGFGGRQFLSLLSKMLAKHLDMYQRFYPEDGQQVRMNPVARRHIPEVTAVRTVSLGTLAFCVGVWCKFCFSTLSDYALYTFIPRHVKVSSGTDATTVSWRSISDLLQHNCKASVDIC